MARVVSSIDVVSLSGLQIGPLAGNFVTFTTAPTAPRTITIPDATGVIVLDTFAQTLTNKTLIDNSTFIKDQTTTATTVFEVSPIGAGNTATLTFSGAGTSTITIPNVTDTLVARTTTDTLTNKTITASTNNVTARALFSNSGANTISVFAAANPTAGQVLTATSSTTATWQNTTPGASTTTGSVTTTNATPTNIETLPTTDDTVYNVSTTVAAIRTDTPGEAAGYQVKATFHRLTGAASLVRVPTGGVDDSLSFEDNTAWNVSFNPNTTSGNIEIQVTGAAGATINWVSSTVTVMVS